MNQPMMDDVEGNDSATEPATSAQQPEAQHVNLEQPQQVDDSSQPFDALTAQLDNNEQSDEADAVGQPALDVAELSMVPETLEYAAGELDLQLHETVSGGVAVQQPNSRTEEEVETPSVAEAVVAELDRGVDDEIPSSLSE